MIYLVEDDDSIRKLVIYALETQGYEAEGFERPSAFWTAMDRQLPELVLQRQPECHNIHRILRRRPDQRHKLYISYFYTSK